MKKEDVKKQIKGDRALKIFSAIIAISLWFYVVQVQNPDITKTVKNVPVVFSQKGVLEEKNLIVLNDNEYTIDVEIRGPRKNVMAVDKKNLTVLADVSGIETTGAHTVVTSIVAPYANLQILGKKPSILSVSVDDLVTKEVPIELVAEGTPRESYVVGDLSANPEEITVRGPKTIMDGIQSLVTTVNVSGKSADMVGVEPIRALGSNQKEIKSQLLSFSKTEVEVHAEILRSKKVELELVFSEGVQAMMSDYVLDESSIKEIQIAGVQALVDSMQKVKTETITERDLGENGELTVTLDLPQGVRSLDGESFTLRFSRKLPEMSE